MAFLRLRDLPGGENIVAYIENGAPVTVYETATDKLGREWHHVLFEQNMPHLFQDEALTQPFTNYVRGYVYGPFVKFPGAHPDPVFTVDRMAITAGESVTLAWNAPGASALRINGKGVTGPANTLVSTPDKTMTYTFVASYDGERDVTITATVTVTPAPVPVEVAQGHIGIHLVWDGDAELDVAIKAGCRMVHSMSMDQCIRAANKLGKTAVFDGKGIVMRRLWLDAQWPANADKFISDVLSYGDKRLIYGGPNECEGLSGDKVRAILDHARFDVYVGTELAKRGFYYSFGVYAVGNPDITKPAEVKALHDGYAEYWNTLHDRYGIWPIEDKHTYSPNATHMYDPTVVVNTMTRWDGSTVQVPTTEQDWHETRQAWNFRLAGWKIDKGLVISGETGIDEGGSGGFPAHGLGAADIVKWGKAYRAAMRRPVTDMYGTTMPMRWIGSTIFQAVDRGTGKGQWGSYCIGDHLGQIGEIY